MVFPTTNGGGAGGNDDAGVDSNTHLSGETAMANATTVIADLLLHNDTFAAQLLAANKTSALTSLLIDGVTEATKVLLNHSSADAAATVFDLSVSTTASSAAANYSDDAFDDDAMMTEETRSDYVFDRTYVRVIFITFYATVFCGCVFGNLMVIVVVTMSRRLRSITNFFLANLAVADLCVGIFCVCQNLSIYLIDSWMFGEFMCQMYQYVQTLSYIASIFILILICVERYCAIIHPIKCKQILTPFRLRIVMMGVWIAAAVCSFPKFLYSRTVTNVHHASGVTEEICIMHRGLFSSKTLDIVSLTLLYVVPLLVMTGLYSRIAIALWKSSHGFDRSGPMHPASSTAASTGTAHASVVGGSKFGGTSGSAGGGATATHHHLIRSCSKYEKRAVAVTESQVSVDSDKVVVTTTWRPQRNCGQLGQLSHSVTNVLRARRGVIRMLIIFVLTFAVFNLPLHARKIYQYSSNSYQGDSNFNAIFTPLTFLAAYFNSALNPLMYAFLSRNFRKGMREVLSGIFKRAKSQQSSSLQQRHHHHTLHHHNQHNHSLPTDITHVGNPL